MGMSLGELIVTHRTVRFSVRSFLLMLVTVSTLAAQTSDAKRDDQKSAEKVAARQDPANRTMNAVWALYVRVPEARYDETPLVDVLSQLSKQLSVNIVVRWQRLEELGVLKDTPISFKVRNLRLSQVLWMIMNQGPLEGVKLAYRADRDMILISTADDLDSYMVVKVYPVEDLIAAEPVAPVMSFGRDAGYVTSVRPTVAAGAVAVQPVIERFRSGVTLSGDNNPFDDEDQNADDDEDDRERRIRELINVITTTLEPDSWQVNGGRGTIAPFRGMLVVRASPRVHQLLGGSLSSNDAP